MKDNRMKNKMVLLLTLMMASLLAGCTIGIGELDKTKTGKEMLDEWTLSTSRFLYSYVETALNFNALLSVPESERANILKTYFEDNNLTIDTVGANHWRITYLTQHIDVVMERGSSLQETGACMRVTKMETNGEELQVVGWPFEISHESDGVWKISKSGNNTSESYLNLQLSSSSDYLPETFFNQSFTLTGEGSYVYGENVIIDEDYNHAYKYTKMDFSIREPIRFVSKPYDWSANDDFRSGFCWGYLYVEVPVFYPESGKLAVYVSNDKGNTSMEATFLNMDEVSINFRGVEQVWKM